MVFTINESIQITDLPTNFTEWGYNQQRNHICQSPKEAELLQCLKNEAERNREMMISVLFIFGGTIFKTIRNHVRTSINKKT